MEMKLEKLKQELKQKNKELDDYIETHENYLSDEAEAIRKEIYRIANEINRIEESKENNEEENVKKFIKTYEEAKAQSFIIESINKDFFFEFADCLIARIKELEEENRIYVLNGDNVNLEIYIKDNYIPKQKVKNKIEELKLSGGSNGKDNVENLARELVIEVLEELLEEK